MPKLTKDDSILAISDVHTSPDGRLLAKKLVESGAVQVFFMEWSKPIAVTDLAGSFSGLSLTDASPTLKDLATVCASKGIDVVSCDLTVDETVSRLDALNDGYGPYNPNSAFQPWGKAMRDKNAAETIRKYMDTHTSAWGHALLMFGADHFVAESDRNAPPLNQLIKEKIGSHNIYLITNPGTANGQTFAD